MNNIADMTLRLLFIHFALLQYTSLAWFGQFRYPALFPFVVRKGHHGGQHLRRHALFGVTDTSSGRGGDAAKEAAGLRRPLLIFR